MTCWNHSVCMHDRTPRPPHTGASSLEHRNNTCMPRMRGSLCTALQNLYVGSMACSMRSWSSCRANCCRRSSTHLACESELCLRERRVCYASTKQSLPEGLLHLSHCGRVVQKVRGLRITRQVLKYALGQLTVQQVACYSCSCSWGGVNDHRLAHTPAQPTLPHCPQLGGVHQKPAERRTMRC